MTLRGMASLGDMPVVKINAISVPEAAHEELEKRFSNRAHTVDGTPGFLGFQLLRPVKGEERYFVVTQWEDEESFAAWRRPGALAPWRRGPRPGGHWRRPAGVRGRHGRATRRLKFHQRQVPGPEGLEREVRHGST